MTAEAECATLELSELEDTSVRVVASPGTSLFALAADVAGAERGVPLEWVAAARAELRRGDLTALAPIGAPQGEFVPACLAGAYDANDRQPTETEVLDRIASIPIETLLEDVAFALGPSLTTRWDAVVRKPRPWLVRYAAALTQTWKTMRTRWAAALALLEAEIERVEIASARGALPELMAGIHPGSFVHDGRWCLPDTEARVFHLPAEGLRLIPVLAAPGATRVHYGSDGRLVSIIYPLPGVTGLVTDEVLPAAAALDALIGRSRAAILRHLDRPRHAGHISSALNATPSFATYHLKALEATGLIRRERARQNVIVHRTTRGTALLALYEER